MNIEDARFLKRFKEMDKESEEFCELFQSINEVYFDFKNPDEYQSSAKMLNTILHKGDEWMIVMVSRLANSLFEIVTKNEKASHGSFEVNDKTYFFDLYQNKDAIEQVHKMFRNTIMVKAGQNDPQ